MKMTAAQRVNGITLLATVARGIEFYNNAYDAMEAVVDDSLTNNIEAVSWDTPRDFLDSLASLDESEYLICGFSGDSEEILNEISENYAIIEG